MKIYCNPLNLPYRYQFFQQVGVNKVKASREGADPSLVLFNGMYYLFPSMTAGFFSSEDMVDWILHPYPPNIPMYDYAPDVRVVGKYLYFAASKLSDECSFFRTIDPRQGFFEEIKGTFSFFDPNLFEDDDGKLYFYWGCSNSTPIWGVELEADTMKPVGEKRELIRANECDNGFERSGDNHVPPKTPEMIEAAVLETGKLFFGASSIDQIPAEAAKMVRQAMGNDTYIEGPWMTKYNDAYYLQYANTGTQFNVYSDGVYVSKSPLGPFSLAKSNPFSYKPGGFINGAGHGSTFEDRSGQHWHVSTMRISINHQFERRVGLWRAGFDDEGELFCDQRYGDWPTKMDGKVWDEPEWMLLSYKKKVKVSSGKDEACITDENIRTWWKAASKQRGQWAEVDLGKPSQIHAIQINFADDSLELPIPQDAIFAGETDKRIIDQTSHATRWYLEGSVDGKHYFLLADKSEVMTDLPHDLVVIEEGRTCRYVRLTILQLPYDQPPCISGLRVFGKSEGLRPDQVKIESARRISDLDAVITWRAQRAVGFNVIWGHSPDKLYHSHMVLDSCEIPIRALIKDEPVFVRVDAFNECGITEGNVQEVL